MALHPYAAHVRYSAAAGPHPAWKPDDGPLPALYLSHGAPPLFEDADWMARLFAWARALPRPRAILIASAHWESAPLALSSASAGTPLVYDFAGTRRRRPPSWPGLSPECSRTAPAWCSTPRAASTTAPGCR
jgi:hypothetical protein